MFGYKEFEDKGEAGEWTIYESTSDPDDDEEEDEQTKEVQAQVRSNQFICGAFCVACFIVAAVSVAVIVPTTRWQWESKVRCMMNSEYNRSICVPNPEYDIHIREIADHIRPSANVSHINPSSLVTRGELTGLDTQYVLQAWILAFVAFWAIWGSAALATCVAIRFPQSVTADFETKGTLSNLCQDVTQPRGRIFAVALFSSGMLLITSMYTFWCYRSWMPWWDEKMNPVYHSTMQPAGEKFFRAVWVVLPQVGFMFTAAIPSLSDTTGAKFVLMMVHNIAAPLSMTFNIIAETVQLCYGENAFQYFFSDANATAFGPLTICQRFRVLTLLVGWLFILVFLGIQVYLGLGSMLGLRIKTSYTIALISFLAEVLMMCAIGLLPALAGMDMYFMKRRNEPIVSALLTMGHLDFPPNGTWSPGARLDF